MAGDWIKMRHDLFTHPKVVRIASALKADNLRTVGGLMSVWCLFDAHSIDGQLDGYSLEYLDSHLRWDGFAQAMVSVGWLVVKDGSLALPSFDTHNGESAKRRCQDADRKRVRRMSASEPDKNGTREEKRREELSINQADSTRATISRIEHVERFAMQTDWLPDDEFTSQLQNSGYHKPWINHLDEFCLYWAGRPEEKHNHFGWQNKFLKNILAKETRREANLA